MHEVPANYGCGAERKKMVYSYCEECMGKFNNIKDPAQRQQAIREEFGTLPNLCVAGSMGHRCPYARNSSSEKSTFRIKVKVVKK